MSEPADFGFPGITRETLAKTLDRALVDLPLARADHIASLSGAERLAEKAMWAEVRSLFDDDAGATVEQLVADADRRRGRRTSS
jgi:hypothetical protein